MKINSFSFGKKKVNLISQWKRHQILRSKSLLAHIVLSKKICYVAKQMIANKRSVKNVPNHSLNLNIGLKLTRDVVFLLMGKNVIVYCVESVFAFVMNVQISMKLMFFVPNTHLSIESLIATANFVCKNGIFVQNILRKKINADVDVIDQYQIIERFSN